MRGIPACQPVVQGELGRVQSGLFLRDALGMVTAGFSQARRFVLCVPPTGLRGLMRVFSSGVAVLPILLHGLHGAALQHGRSQGKGGLMVVVRLAPCRVGVLGAGLGLLQLGADRRLCR